jgi:hypothetical protein
MNIKVRKYISCLLLLVFSFSSLPHSLFHELFAGHTDTEENYCDYYHKNLGTHIESQQTHCDIFKGNTPLYDAVKIELYLNLSSLIISQYKIGQASPYSFAQSLRLPSRAPPAC